MFVRWVVRRHKNALVANTSFHDAYLLESYRDTMGSPRQRTICYLGNIRQMGDDFPPIERELFLLRAERILDTVIELNGEERAAVMEMLHQKVRPLTDGEVLAAFTENLRWYRRWWDQHGILLSDDQLFEIVRASKERIGPI